MNLYPSLVNYSLCYDTIVHYVAGGKDYFQTYQTHVPAFLPVPHNITVHEGDTAHLKCRIKSLGTKTVTCQTEKRVKPQHLPLKLRQL